MIIIILSIVTIIYIYITNQSTAKSETQVELYFPNLDSKILELERKALIASTTDDKVVEVLQYLFESGPSSPNLTTITDGNRPYQEFEIENGSVVIFLNNIYHDLDNIEKLYARASMTWSLTSIDKVKNIIFYDSGSIVQLGSNPESVLHNRANVRLNPIIDPKDTIAVDFKLFFANETLTNLTPENQIVYVNPNNIVEEYIVTQLIEGTKVSSNRDVIPQGTKVIKVETENKICYVNLSNEFVSKMPNDLLMQELAVYSIVNSLTTLDKVDSVQILIDSRRISAFGNELDLKNTLTYNESLVSQ